MFVVAQCPVCVIIVQVSCTMVFYGIWVVPFVWYNGIPWAYISPITSCHNCRIHSKALQPCCDIFHRFILSFWHLKAQPNYIILHVLLAIELIKCPHWRSSLNQQIPIRASVHTAFSVWPSPIQILHDFAAFLYNPGHITLMIGLAPTVEPVPVQWLVSPIEPMMSLVVMGEVNLPQASLPRKLQYMFYSEKKS